MSERAEQRMIPESCKVIGTGLAALGICKSNVLGMVVNPADLKTFLEIVVLSFTAVYTGARACSWVWAGWVWWGNRKAQRNEKS